MSNVSPVVQQAFRELKAANRVLLRAMAREKRTRAAYEQARALLTESKRNVELLLKAVQPELPTVGELPAGEVHHDPA